MDFSGKGELFGGRGSAGRKGFRRERGSGGRRSGGEGAVWQKGTSAGRGSAPIRGKPGGGRIGEEGALVKRRPSRGGGLVKFDRKGVPVERSPGRKGGLARDNSVEVDLGKSRVPVREKTPARGRPDEKEVPAEGAR